MTDIVQREDCSVAMTGMRYKHSELLTRL